MYSNVQAILTQISTQVQTAVIGLLPTATLSFDEPLSLTYTSLPEIAIYPLMEKTIESDSFTQDKKELSIRIEIRQKGGPASSVSTPVVNAICDSLKQTLRLNNLIDWLSVETIQWANDRVVEGAVCGASIDLTIHYLI